MAAITDPRVVKFVNEQLRPACESLRATKSQVDSILDKWNAEIAALVPNDASALADGRDAEGVSRLAGSEINTMITILTGLQSRFNLAGVSAAIAKGCVRAEIVN